MRKLLDLFCCEGGASMGYHRAGFEVVGVDLVKSSRYPFEFYQGDALEFLKEFGHEFDAIAASPPCQLYSNTHKIRKNEHPDLVGPVRELLAASGKPYMIENVEGAPLEEPVTLCGSMFGMRTYRHRLFETNWGLKAPDHQEHRARTAKMGRPVKDGENMHIVGNFTGVALARQIMDMPWASRSGMAEAVPPAYTEYIGKQLMGLLENR